MTYTFLSSTLNYFNALQYSEAVIPEVFYEIGAPKKLQYSKENTRAGVSF